MFNRSIIKFYYVSFAIFFLSLSMVLKSPNASASLFTETDDFRMYSRNKIFFYEPCEESSEGDEEEDKDKNNEEENIENEEETEDKTESENPDEENKDDKTD